MDSLDMLEEYLIGYKGTLLVVSHDRDFLDNVVTSILAFEGNGVIESHLGGYSDYIEYKSRQENLRKDNVFKAATSSAQLQNKSDNRSFVTLKFTNKLRAELERLPEKIENLEIKIAELSEELSMTEDRSSANLAHISIEIAKLQKNLDTLEARWIELEELKKQ